MEPKISVIIPVYNVERFLTDCVESCLAQTMKDIEYIFVDDCSPDRCGKILDAYQNDYPEQIRVIHLEKNLKQGGARNVGIANARASWIGFIDSDDMIVPDMYETLYKNATVHDADVAFIQYGAVDESTQISDMILPAPIFQWHPNLMRWNGKQLTNQGRMDLLAYQIGGVCCGLWKKQVLEDSGVKFPEGIRYEDNYWISLIKCYLQKVCFVEQVKYCYRQNSNSTLHTRNQTYQLDRIYAEQMLMQDVQERGCFERYQVAWEFLFVFRYVINTCNLLIATFDHPPVDKIVQLCAECRSRYPRFYGNSYYKEYYSVKDKCRNMALIYMPAVFVYYMRLKSFVKNTVKKILAK